MSKASNSILRRIRAKKRGWVFTPKDFIDMASRALIDVTLHRLHQQGIIRKLDRGIYDFPITHSKLGMLAPKPDTIAKAAARKTGNVISPSGARAANQLGIDLQVPKELASLSSGAKMKLTIGNHPISLRHSKYVGRNNLSKNTTNTINALRHLGKENITPAIGRQLNKVLTTKDKRNLHKNIAKFPDWIAPIILQLKRK